MKECSRDEVLKGKKSQYDPPYPSRWSVGPGGQRDQEQGVVQHVQGEGYQPPKTSRSGSSQVPEGLRMTPPTHTGWQVDSKVKDMGYFYMFREKKSDLLILRILILSLIGPNQRQYTSPWA